MTAIISYLNIFIVLICGGFCWSPDERRRFSDFKRCADEECSMLLCRGKASKDFIGPDCRFLAFKAGETIYVYYKLSGQRSDVWAGSVGNSFGYFPKDFLNINHIYTENEIEVPAEDTDFVCFATGLDHFESYDLDVLLRNSLKQNEVDEPKDGTSFSEDEETEETDRESLQTESDTEHDVESEDETTASDDKDNDSYDVGNPSESVTNNAESDQERDTDLMLEASPQEVRVLEKSHQTTRVETVSELKTTLGTTFDAVTSDDEDTQKVTPYEDGNQSDDLTDEAAAVEEERVQQPSLLTFEEKTGSSENVPDGTESEEEHTNQEVRDVEKSDQTTRVETVSELKTTLGMMFDAVTSDDEDTRKVTPYEDGNQSDDLTEEAAAVEEEHMQEPLLLTFEEKPSSSENNVPDGTESEEEHVQVLIEEKALSEDAADDNDREVEETKHREVENSDSLHQETGTDLEKPVDLQSSETSRRTLETTSSHGNNHDHSRVTNTAGGESDQERDKDLMHDEALPQEAGIVEKSDQTTRVETVSELKTTLGTTFDAVTSDDEDTRKVTLYGDGNQSDDLTEEAAAVEEEHVQEPSLLTFEERSVPDGNESKDEPMLSESATKDDSVWSNFGDPGFEIVSGERADLTEDGDGDGDDVEVDEGMHSQTTKKGSADLQTNLDYEINEVADHSKASTNDNFAVQQENTHLLQYHNGSEEMKTKTINLNKTITEAVESEPDGPTSPTEDIKQVLDEHSESSAERTVLVESGNSEVLFKEDVPRVSELEKQMDEQIDRVKKEIINLFENTLKNENGDAATDYRDDVDEELLEDENALLATKVELTTEEESIESIKVESPLEENELVTPEEPHDSRSSEPINQDGKASVDTLVDASVDRPADDKTSKPVEESRVIETRRDSSSSKEPEYSDSVLRLTLIRDHFKDKDIERIMRHLTIKDLYRVEAMFTKMDHQLNSAKQLHSENSDLLERTLENIVEVSENAILNEIDKMLDAREQHALELGQQIDSTLIDEAGTVLDDFQDFAFYLHKKYSPSFPVVKEDLSHLDVAENVSEEVETPVETVSLPKVSEIPEVHEEAGELFRVEGQEDEAHSQDVGPGDDGGHFNKNEDIQAAFQETADIQRRPQSILENPLDILGFEMNPSLDSDSSRASDFSENNENPNGESMLNLDLALDYFLLASEYLGVYADILMAALPEEWQPGPTFYGLPWTPVVVTAVLGFLTVFVFMWGTVLSVKNRMYLLSEKQLIERIQQLITEKSDVLQKITELNNSIKQYEEQLSDSKESRSCLQKEFIELKTRYQDLNSQNEKLRINVTHLSEKIVTTQEENKTLNQKISTMQQGIKKYEKTLKVYDEERSKVQVLMDEAKLREDALKAEVLSFEKDNSTLKDQKRSLLQDAKEWQEKHEKLSEEIKVYHKTQSELENALVHKGNEIEVLSGCIAELKSLESCQENNEMENDKSDQSDPLKLHLKQMMDVSRIKATLSVIEEERNRWFENFMAEQKARQELEEKFQKVVHDQTNLKNEKTHLENQYKNLQQRLEITTELYHQKENILHQKLTQEELERHEKESKLSEVDGRALQAEEELHHLRQKVKDMQDEMQQNERSLKAEISVQEKKAHENWLKARASERALVEERRESANLRQKIVECTDKMSDLEHALYKSNPPERHNAPIHRGDSYGPSPVSGGAPSPPLMIDDPGRPASGPVGRRGEHFGPRLPLDGHSRPDLGHPLPFRPELSAPRTSSPCAHDGALIAPIDVKTEVLGPVGDPTEALCKSQASFLPSPIRESPIPALNAPLKVYGVQPMGGPLPPMNGPLPPVMRPPNGHPPMIPPGPPYGPETRFRMPHMDPYRPHFPLRPYGPIPPPFVPGPPLREFPSMGPNPSAHSLRDFPPNFARLQDSPFPHRQFPPPGTMIPPSVGTQGPAPPTLVQPSESQMIPLGPDGAPEQETAQNAAPPAVTRP